MHAAASSPLRRTGVAPSLLDTRPHFRHSPNVRLIYSRGQICRPKARSTRTMKTTFGHAVPSRTARISSSVTPADAASSVATIRATASRTWRVMPRAISAAMFSDRVFGQPGDSSAGFLRFPQARWVSPRRGIPRSCGRHRVGRLVHRPERRQASPRTATGCREPCQRELPRP